MGKSKVYKHFTAVHMCVLYQQREKCLYVKGLLSILYILFHEDVYIEFKLLKGFCIWTCKAHHGDKKMKPLNEGQLGKYSIGYQFFLEIILMGLG